MKKRGLDLLSLACVACVIVATSSTGRGTTIALDFTPGTGGNNPMVGYGGYSVGWAFTVNTAVNVTGLAWYDEGGNGLVESHDVGIYSMAVQDPNTPGVELGNLLINTMVQSGTTDPLADGSLFRVRSASYTLLPGNYVIAGYTGATGADGFHGSIASLFTIPEISYLYTPGSSDTYGGLYIPSGGLAYPYVPSDRQVAYFGPSFTVSSAVPDGGCTLTLLGLTTGGIAWVRRKTGK